MSRHSATPTPAGPEALAWLAGLLCRGWRWLWASDDDQPPPPVAQALVRFGTLLVLFLVALSAGNSGTW